jgi:Fic family protein
MNTRPADWQPDRPHNALPDLPPPVDLESKAVLRHCIRARAALAELKQASELIPNPTLLIHSLPLLEARASSEIENIVTTADQLFRHVGYEQQADPATKEALRHSRALFEGVQSLRRHPLTTRTAMEVCSQIKGVEMQVRRVPGTALQDERSGEIIYTPPEGEALLLEKLGNWERFLHKEDQLDPLIRLAVAHYQFEAIHPFTDGNGRTGRVLNSLFLVQQGLLSLPILYLSRYIIQHKADYYRLLQDVTRHQAWEPWVLYLLAGIAETAEWTRDKIAAIRTLFELTSDHVRRLLPRLHSHELLTLIFTLPYCRISTLTEAGIAKRQTASVYLKQLTEIGVLREVPTTKEKLFLHPRLLQLLTREDHPILPLGGDT